MSYTLTLPWPARELSPNARCHWAKKARAAKAAKEEGYYAMLEAKLRNGEHALEGPIELLLILRPPDKKRRDDDNVLASLKNFRDVIGQIRTTEQQDVFLKSANDLWTAKISDEEPGFKTIRNDQGNCNQAKRLLMICYHRILGTARSVLRGLI